MAPTTPAWPPELAQRLADYITALRRRADLSQRELAALAGVPATTVARLESGATSDPQLSTMAKLAAATGHRLVIADDHNELVPPEPELRGDCRELRGRRIPAHLDVAPAVEDWLRPWWVLTDRDLTDRDRADRE